MKILILTAFLIGVSSTCFAATWATEWTQILNNIQLIQQTKNQIEGLYNDASMIRNQVESLKSIASYKGSWERVNQLLLQIDAIKQQNEAVWNNVQGVYNRAKELYPGIDKQNDHAMALEALNDPLMAVADGAMMVTAEQAQRTAKENEALQSLLQKSDEALGQTQALQTMNQLMVQLITQMQELRALNEWQLAQKSAELKKQALLENKEQQQMQEIFHEYKGSKSTKVLSEGF